MISIPQYLDFPTSGKTKEICEFFLNMLERKNKFIYLHSQQVANYAVCTAAQLGLSPSEIKTIRTGAIMHDIGHLSVPNVILNKAPYLSVRELAQYKKHCLAGYSMLENMEEFNNIINLIRSHHEHWDGTGYPAGLHENEILLGAKIVAVADVVEAISAHRPYRPALGIDKALEEIERMKGIQFDKEVVDVCLNLFRKEGFKFF